MNNGIKLCVFKSHISYSYQQVKLLTLEHQRKYSQAYARKPVRGTHYYKNLHPWKNDVEFGKHLISSIFYNKNGLIALNKPFGVKIHGHDKPGARTEPGKHKMVPYIPDCRYTLEDSLPILKEHLNAPDLSILKSAEKYTSGIVLLGTEDRVATALKRSFDASKRQKTPHFVHWMMTLGYPVSPYRKEKVGIKFLIGKPDEPKQPVITLKFSKNAVKNRIVSPVNVEYRVLSQNTVASSSLVEISTSATKFHFVRVYASSRIAPILGDILYGSRMKTVIGVPIKVHAQSDGFEMQPLPTRLSEALALPKGLQGHLTMPTMLHLRSLLLSSFEGEDITITAPPPTYFQWTAEQLNLLQRCK